MADPDMAARRIADHLPQGETVISPGTGHGVLTRIPDRIAARTLEFAEQHDRTGATAG